MFQLTWDEVTQIRTKDMVCIENGSSSRSQNVTLMHGQNIKYLPYAFTEQGVAMLSSVLRSKRAIQVNISIMRAFVQFRQVLAAHKELSDKLKDLEHKIGQHDKEIRIIFEAIHRLMLRPETPKRKIGFHAHL
jgi:hypothetical protein